MFTDASNVSYSVLCEWCEVRSVLYSYTYVSLMCMCIWQHFNSWTVRDTGGNLKLSCWQNWINVTTCPLNVCALRASYTLQPNIKLCKRVSNISISVYIQILSAALYARGANLHIFHLYISLIKNLDPRPFTYAFMNIDRK